MFELSPAGREAVSSESKERDLSSGCCQEFVTGLRCSGRTGG